jgi:hypothetical protein
MKAWMTKAFELLKASLEASCEEDRMSSHKEAPRAQKGE